MVEENDKKRLRIASLLEDEEVVSPEVKKLKQDLFDNLDDIEFFSKSVDLDKFIKSFEDEISIVHAPPQISSVHAPPLTVPEEDCDVSFPDLWYLLEASDDELGLPPPSTVEEVAEVAKVSTEWREFGDNINEFESFDVGVGNEYVALDGLFDYWDMGFGSGDFVC